MVIPIIAAIVLVIAACVTYVLSKKALEDKHITLGEIARIVAVWVLAGVLLGVSAASFTSASVGHAVIIADPIRNEVQGPITGPVWFFRWPWTQALDIYYATDSYEDTIPCFSSDQLEMAITVQMRWQLKVDKLTELYKSYPRLDYEEIAIDPIMEETIRLVTKNFSALETIEFREQVAQQIEDEVFRKVGEETSLAGALGYLRFDLKNIGYPAEYTKAIEEKLVKEQQKLGAEFERQKILILANATAQEIMLKAKGEAEAKLLIASSIKEAIRMIIEASGGNPQNQTRIAELYLWVETLKTIAPEIDIFIMSSEGVAAPIIIPVPANSTSPEK